MVRFLAIFVQGFDASLSLWGSALSHPVSTHLSIGSSGFSHVSRVECGFDKGIGTSKHGCFFKDFTEVLLTCGGADEAKIRGKFHQED